MTVIYRSPYNVDIPTTDIVSFVFSAGTENSRKKPQYYDAKDPDQCFSLYDAERYVRQIACGLQRLGLKRNDKVLLYCNNRLFFPVLFWGVVAAGCVFTATSPTASVSELEYHIKDSGAKLVLTAPDKAAICLEAATRCGLPANSVYAFCNPQEDLSLSNMLGLQPWTQFWASEEEAANWTWRKFTSLEEARSTVAVLNYSSGTTGSPKGVEISHYNLVANSIQLTHKRGLVADTPQARSRQTRLHASGERWLAPLPMYHVYGQTYYCMNAVLCGAKVFIMETFDIRRYLSYLDIYRITFMTSVPTILVMLSKYASAGSYNLSAIESVVSGSAPLNPEVGRRFRDEFLRSDVSVKQGWGMTESTCSIAGFAIDDEDDGKSVGWPHANCTIRIEPIEGREFEATANGEAIGELWVSGPNIMMGYYNRPEQTTESIVVDEGERWLRTGDIGYLDQRGCVYIVDRLKELIKVKGLQVAPAELELLLQTHPDITDAAVVGAKLDGDEYPRAFVVRNGERIGEDTVKSLIKENFAPHKWITGGVYFIDAIPRLANGKIKRRALPNPKLVLEKRRNKL